MTVARLMHKTIFYFYYRQALFTYFFLCLSIQDFLLFLLDFLFLVSSIVLFIVRDKLSNKKKKKKKK